MKDIDVKTMLMLCRWDSKKLNFSELYAKEWAMQRTCD